MGVSHQIILRVPDAAIAAVSCRKGQPRTADTSSGCRLIYRDHRLYEENSVTVREVNITPSLAEWVGYTIGGYWGSASTVQCWLEAAFRTCWCMRSQEMF